MPLYLITLLIKSNNEKAGTNEFDSFYLIEFHLKTALLASDLKQTL